MSDGPPEPDDGVAWRIESFDPRAGLAFAVWRGERDTEAESKSIDWPCLYFAPPGFTPEPVGNVALALGASRGSFQPGLLVEGREAFFRTPEEVAEFVRRAYVGGAGGAGDEGGGGPPQGDGDGGGEPERPREPERDLDRVSDDGIFWNEQYTSGFLWQGVKAFATKSATLKFGVAAEFSWQAMRTQSGVEPLVVGALGVMQRLFARMPSVGQTRDLIRWNEDVQILGGCLSRIGLWPELQFGSQRDTFYELLHDLEIPDDRWGSVGPPERMYALFFDGWMPYDFRRVVFHQQDPVDLLRRLPVPTWAGNLAGEDAARQSLFHALSSFIASPQLILTAAPTGVHFVLFASACLVTCASQWRARPWPYEGAWAHDMNREAVQVVAEQSFDWLIEHLPTRAFSRGFEDAIEQTRHGRYGE